MPGMTRKQQAAAIKVTVIRMLIDQCNGLDQPMEQSLAVRDAVSRCFRGTTFAGIAVQFVEQYMPPGGPLTEEAKDRLLALAEAVETDSLQTFSW